MSKRKRSQRREQASKRAKYPLTHREYYRTAVSKRASNDNDDFSEFYSTSRRENNRYR